MAKLAARFITVALDDDNPTIRQIEGDLDSIDLPLEYDELDVTGFSDGVKNSIPGMPGVNVELSGTFNPASGTGLFTVIKSIVGDYSGHTLTVQIGQNAAPTSSDPEFEGEFWCPKLQVSATPTGKVVLNASLRVYGTALPAWGTV